MKCSLLKQSRRYLFGIQKYPLHEEGILLIDTYLIHLRTYLVSINWS